MVVDAQRQRRLLNSVRVAFPEKDELSEVRKKLDASPEYCFGKDKEFMYVEHETSTRFLLPSVQMLVLCIPCYPSAPVRLFRLSLAL